MPASGPSMVRLSAVRLSADSARLSDTVWDAGNHATHTNRDNLTHGYHDSRPESGDTGSKEPSWQPPQ